MANQTILESIFTEHFDIAREQLAFKRVSGGCIAETWQVSRQGTPWAFCKLIPSAQHNSLETEALSLESLRETNTIRIPEVLATGAFEGFDYLVLEWIENAPEPASFMKHFGRKLAQLHLARTDVHRFGFPFSTSLGSYVQDNQWNRSWIEFFRVQRLQPQIDWAIQNKYFDVNDQRLAYGVLDRMENLLVEPDHPALIHGDLWSGNYLCDGNGEAVLIDSAAYWGHAEAEWGMLTLFGNVTSEFVNAYTAVLPFTKGYQSRIKIYRWYHLLNHLNLFGVSYLQQCKETLVQIVD
ncbi:MAG: fructosamine kinase family protein [Pirellulaceae bacterium]